MATIEMVMPQMGESILEGTILTWLKKEGDIIEQDESVLEVATDKVDTEVPALVGGILKKILVQEGDVIKVGTPIALIETEDIKEDTIVEPITNGDLPREKMASPNRNLKLSPSPVVLNVEDERFYSPLVKNMAREEGISKMELATVPGSGKGGRVTKQDMLNYLMNRQADTESPISNSIPKEAPDVSSGNEIKEMNRRRSVIAKRMLDPKKISAHVTSFVEA